jgi:hypothetical protein
VIDFPEHLSKRTKLATVLAALAVPLILAPALHADPVDDANYVQELTMFGLTFYTLRLQSPQAEIALGGAKYFSQRVSRRRVTCSRNWAASGASSFGPTHVETISPSRSGCASRRCNERTPRRTRTPGSAGVQCGRCAST